MLNIEVRFAVPFAYQNPFVTLHEREHVLSFQLEPGTHIAESAGVDLGVAHRVEGRRILGKFSFEYTYEPDRKLITVCGTDFDSSRAMCLTTMPEGTTEVCRQRVGGGFRVDDLGANPRWNYVTALTPGLEDVFEGAVRAVNDRLIEALEKVPELIVQVRKHPPKLPPEDQQKFLTVYQQGKFQGFHETGREYAAGEEVYSVESVWGGEVTLNYQESFANVIGSTGDPQIGGLSWIRLWAGQYNIYPIICTSYQFGRFNCDESLVGGHVIGGTQAQVVPYGSNSVWIFPICSNHNKNDNVYMAAIKYLKGIWLHNYMGR